MCALRICSATIPVVVTGTRSATVGANYGADASIVNCTVLVRNQVLDRPSCTST
jgi:hypothetical protein